MQKTCSNNYCKESFEVNAKDLEALQKFGIEDFPDYCTQCRHQFRAMFKGSLGFHKRQSSLSGKNIISLFSKEKTFPVYSIDEWWSDSWDALDYGKTIDFSRPFFKQFAELFQQIPKPANFNEKCENCDYNSYAGNSKNAYYCDLVHRSEEVFFSETITGYCNNICDCNRCYRSSYLYQSVLCLNAHYSSYLLDCSTIRDCHFCIDCHGCNDCLFSHNLRNKQYYVKNKALSKEEFFRVKNNLLNGSWKTLQENLKEFAAVYAATIWKDCSLTECEDCLGDTLSHCANCYQCFNCINSVDNRYCCELSPSEKNVNSMDITSAGIGELLYNSTALGGGNYFMRMCSQCRASSELTYCIDCYYSKNCFGCSGLKNKQYCILNKQYEKKEYEILRDKLIEQMKKNKEWGNFFPVEISPFAYNKSIALRLFPLSKEEVLKRGWSWEEEAEQHLEEQIQEDSLPDKISQSNQEICQKVFQCIRTGRKYKILPQELKLLEILNQPLPHLHPDERISERRKLLKPYKLWKRSCLKCDKAIQSSFSPNRSEIVYCSACYLAEIY